MKTLIIASGNFGATVKAGQMLASMLDGADVLDTLQPNQHIDFTSYDIFVFGSNVRMFMLNRRFKMWARKLKKAYANKVVYGYLIGAKPDNDRALANMSAKLKNNMGVVYAWGELNAESASDNWKQMIETMRDDIVNKGNILPYIDQNALQKIAEDIKQLDKTK